MTELPSGDLQLSRARIRIRVEDVVLAPPCDASNVGTVVVRKAPQLLPRVTAAVNAEVGLEMGSLVAAPAKDDARQRCEEAAQPFREAPKANSRLPSAAWPVVFVAIVRAIGARSKVLVFEEPTSSLGASERSALHSALLDVALSD